MKLHWYELTLRGISPGCQPDGFKDKDFNYGKYGAVAYDRQLRDEEVSKYEMKEINK
ncbi:defense against restriction DarA-related protein [Salinicoccus sp. Marseille-QA3877]